MRIVAIVILAFAIPAAVRLRGHSRAVTWLLCEDAVYETLGAVMSLWAGALLLAAAWRHARSGPLGRGFASAALGGALVLLALEEISWGQRLLAVESGELVARLNAQSEWTLHNLRIFDAGPGINWVFPFFVAAMVIYLVALPLACRFVPPLARGLGALRVPVARGGIAAGAAAAFVLLFVLSSRRAESRVVVTQEVIEIFETVIEGLLLALAVDVYRQAPAGSRRATAVLLTSLALLTVGWVGATAWRLAPHSADELGQAIAAQHVAAGKRCLDLGQTEAAEALFHDALTIRPDDPEVLGRIALAHAEAGDPRRARQLVDAALAAHPEAAALWVARGFAYALDNRPGEAAAAFERALELRPDDDATRENLRQIRALLERRSGAGEPAGGPLTRQAP